jgi:RimJ/RimL family protein N-acetyltransferase
MHGAHEPTRRLAAADPAHGVVRLRDVVVADLPVFFEHQQDPQAIRMAAFPPRGQQAFAEHWQQILDNRDVVKKTILHDRRVVGNLVSFEQSGRMLVGYWLGREHWGKGIATAALTQFLRVVTRRPIYAFVAKRNAGSLRVLEKCGFRILSEGIGAPDDNGQAVAELALILTGPAIRPADTAHPAVNGSMPG